MATRNVIEYEFQGNLYPLEQAFKKVRSLFLKSVKEAKNFNDGKLTSGLNDAYTEIENLTKRLTKLRLKQKTKELTKQEIADTKRLYKRIVTLTNSFTKQKDRLIAQRNKEELRQQAKQAREQAKLQKQQEKEALQQEQEQQRLLGLTQTAPQFKAATQVEQLQDFMQAIPTLPASVVADINNYILAWQEAKKALQEANQQFKEGKINAQQLNEATMLLGISTDELDKKSREYVGSLKILNHEQKVASNMMEYVLQGIISQVSSFETWYRTIKEGITLLGDYIESLNFLEVAIENINYSSYTDGALKAANATSQLKNKIDAARWSLGLNATDLNTATAIFISFANAIGMTGDEVVTFSENISQLAVDMASLYNKDVTVVATALKSALAGNTRSLMNYGISVHDATLNEWLLSKGLNKTMSSLSETSQAMVRYLYIMEKTSGAQGDLNRTLKSPSNQLKILNNQITLLKQNLGSLFNVVIYPSVRILNEVLIPLNAFISALTELANANYSSSIGSITDAADDATEALDNASDAAVGLTDLDEINQETESTTTTGVDADIQSLIDATKVYDNFLGTTSKLTELMKALGEAMAPIWSIFANTNIIDALTSSINFLLGALDPVKKVLEAIKTGFQDSPSWMQAILNVILQMVGTLTSLGTTIGVVAVAWAGLQAVMKSTLFANFIGTLTKMWKHFLLLGESIYAAIAKFVTWIATIIKARIEALKTSIANKGLAATLVSIAKSAAMAVVNLIKLIGKLILQGAKAVWTAIKNLILSKSLWGVALGAIAAAGIAAVAVAGVVGTAVLIGKAVQNQNQATENTVGLATGGVVTGPTFAMIGEGKYDEAVVPLGNSPQFKSMKEGIAQEVVSRSSSSSNSNRPLILTINGKELARTILPDLKQALPQTGMRLAK